MFTSNLTRFLALGSLALGLFTTAYAEKINPTRVGPVSQYGQLQAGTNNAGEGRIYGSCEHFRSSGNEVQVKGMSLFWSCAANQQRYWKKDIITGLVERQNIQLIRAAMAVDDMGDWADGHYFTKPDFYQAMLDEAVEAAIENDIYVIIDFHSHVAADSVENAKSFFRIQAEKWGKYDNVIFEVFNEPICASGSVGDNSDCSEYGGFISMDDIKTYADQVISVIREYSDNLIIVGTPMWDQYPNQAIYNHVEDPLERDNIAYAFHYYAGRADGNKAHEFSLTSNANFAMQKGLSVFVSEWGTVGYDGGGAPSAALNPQWQTWMDSRKISSANWNVGKSGDPSSEAGSEYFGFDFDPDNAPDNWTYSLSGQWVNANVFNDLPATYTACDDYVPASSSSSDVSSSSDARSYAVEPYYTYVYAGGGWTIANEEGEFGLVAEVIDEETGKPVIGLKGVVAENENGWAGIGMNVGGLDGCQLLQYDYKGLSHNLALANTPDGDDVIAKYGIPATDAWETFTLDMSALSGIDLQSGLDIKWQLAGTGNGNLYVNNVRCAVPSSSSSSGDEPASSSSIKLPVVAAPTTNTELVDDFEDGDMYPLWSVGNYWAESDRGDNGGNTTAQLDVVPGNGGKVLQLTYAYDVGKYAYNPFATISTNDFGNLNLSQCSAIQYDYKGSAHKFRIKVSENVNNLLEMGWGFHTYTVDHPSATWQTVSIPLASLRQEWGKEVPIEIAMQYANGFDWRVEAEDRMSTETGTLSIDNIRCIGLAETRYYTVTFKNGEETLLEKSWAEGSNTYDPGLTPVRAPDPQFTYTFTGWTPSLLDMYWEPVKVTANAVYQAEFDSEIRTYTVTFLMDDGETEYATANAEYDTPVQDILPENPAKDATDEYTYTFNSWSPSVTDAVVTGDMFYVASFGATKKQYSIAFVDVDDETVLKAATLYDYGTPFDEIDAPTVSDNGGWRFAGWTPNPATVTEDVTYRATYTQKFIITWKDDDGSVLRYDYHDAGEIPDYGEDPTKPATAQYSYDFTGWTPAVTDVTGDAVYTATYSAAVNAYEVAFMDDQGEEIIATSSYPYGTQVQTIAPNLSAGDAVWSTAGESCLFTGWNPVILGEAVVTGDKAYTAQCTVVPNKYSITFVMDDGTTPVATVTRDYGTLINDMLPDEPTKTATNAKTFEFARWVTLDGQSIAEDAELEGNTTLKAVFNEFDRMYAVAFVDYDNTVLKPATFYTYGATVEVPDDPTRDAAGIYTYEFRDWNPAVTTVTGEAIYKATYDSTAHYGAIAVSVIDGQKTATIEGTYKGADKVEINEDIVVDTVVFDRTLSNGVFSTIVMPFEINVDDVDGADFYTITEFTKNGNTWKNATAQKVPVNGQLEANKPYLMQPKSDKLVFHGELTLRTSDAPNSTFSEGAWEFRGAYNYIVFGDSTHLLGKAYGFAGVEANGYKVGEFARAGSKAWIPAMRAYLVYNDGGSAGKSAVGGSGSLAELPETLDVILVDEKGATIGGGTVNTVTGQFRMDHWYDLQGRKLQGKPTTKGTYYHSGKMVIVK